MKYLLSSLLVLFFLGTSFTSNFDTANPGWKLTKEKGDIKVYSRKNDAGFKEIRMTTTIKAPIENFISVLNDTKKYKEWVYKCSEARKTKSISADEFHYYVELDFPFPASDRDLIVQTKQWLDAQGKYHSRSVSTSDNVIVDENNIRIKDYESMWSATPKKDGTLFLEYESSSDPGGSIPQWIVNIGVGIGPLKSMEGVIKLTLE